MTDTKSQSPFVKYLNYLFPDRRGKLIAIYSKEMEYEYKIAMVLYGDLILINTLENHSGK